MNLECSRPAGDEHGGPYLPSQFFRKMNTFQTIVFGLHKVIIETCEIKARTIDLPLFRMNALGYTF